MAFLKRRGQQKNAAEDERRDSEKYSQVHSSIPLNNIYRPSGQIKRADWLPLLH